MESEIALAWPLWTAAAGILFLAGVTQGALGFGFPAISTPLLVLMTDVKTAIILNLCFLGGKVVQGATLGLAGEIALSAVIANVPLTLVALAGMWIGTRLQQRISPAAYGRLLRWVLFVIAVALLWQGMRYFLR